MAIYRKQSSMKGRMSPIKNIMICISTHITLSEMVEILLSIEERYTLVYEDEISIPKQMDGAVNMFRLLDALKVKDISVHTGNNSGNPYPPSKRKFRAPRAIRPTREKRI
jgi:hypothetical protein